MYEIRKENLGHFTSPEQVAKYKQALAAKSEVLGAARKIAAWDNKPGDYNDDAGTVVLADYVEKSVDDYSNRNTWSAALTFEPQRPPATAPAAESPAPAPAKKKWYSWIPFIGGRKTKDTGATSKTSPSPQIPESAFKALKATMKAPYSTQKTYGLSVDENGTRRYEYNGGTRAGTFIFEEDVSGNLFIQT